MAQPMSSKRSRTSAACCQKHGSSPRRVMSLPLRLRGAHGTVDILVNNAGSFEIKDAFEIPDEDLEIVPVRDQRAVRRPLHAALSPDR